LWKIRTEGEKLTEQLQYTDDRLEVGAAVIEAALDLLDDRRRWWLRLTVPVTTVSRGGGI
jgi:hypothetical protein